MYVKLAHELSIISNSFMDQVRYRKNRNNFKFNMGITVTSRFVIMQKCSRFYVHKLYVATLTLVDRYGVSMSQVTMDMFRLS